MIALPTAERIEGRYYNRAHEALMKRVMQLLPVSAPEPDMNRLAAITKHIEALQMERNALLDSMARKSVDAMRADLA